MVHNISKFNVGHKSHPLLFIIQGEQFGKTKLTKYVNIEPDILCLSIHNPLFYHQILQTKTVNFSDTGV